MSQCFSLCWEYICVSDILILQIMKCTQELEARSQSNNSLELYNLYCETPPADEVGDLLKKLQESTNVDLSEYNPVCIASVFKKYLRELPDPLIPVQWYDQFLEASSK